MSARGFCSYCKNKNNVFFRDRTLLRGEKLLKRSHPFIVGILTHNFPAKQRAVKFPRWNALTKLSPNVCMLVSKVLLWLQSGENLEGKKTLRDVFQNGFSSTFCSLPNITFFKLSVLLPHPLGFL